MKAMIYNGPGRLAPGDIDEPVIREPSDAIVRVTTGSICTSDLHIRAGAVPRAVPGIAVGHEFVGVVESIGSGVSNIKTEDRVAVNCETYCGECYFCRHGWVNNCTDPNGGWALGCRIDGGQAEKARIPFADNCLTPVPDDVSDEAALLTGDLLSTGYWAADIGDIEEGDTVAVVGAGPTGICCAMMARAMGAGRIVLIDVGRTRLDFAMNHGYGDIVVDPSSEDADAVIKDLTEGRGADVVMEVAGGKDSLRTAWTVARPNAVVVIVAMYEEDQVLPLPEMYGKNLVFKTGGVDGCHCAEIMRMVSEGRIDATPLITHRFPFSRIEEAYDLFSQRRDGVMKIAVTMDRRCSGV